MKFIIYKFQNLRKLITFSRMPKFMLTVNIYSRIPIFMETGNRRIPKFMKTIKYFHGLQ